MEKAFKLNNKSKFVVNLEKYIKAIKDNNIEIKKIFGELGIEATKYYLRGDGFVNKPFDEYEKNDIEISIAATDNDKLKFFKELCKPDEHDMCKFRKSSKTMKRIQDFCIENKLIINPSEPDLRDYFKSMRWRGYRRELFKRNDIWYLKVVNDEIKENDIPEGFEEIKLSEYFCLKEQNERNS